ncbi:hypothetical protein GON26_01210 [Flavobacterium sp. GA093]|uniref:Uncharacterized protein n=1 Tax=Flavobacterium hydrocarbonoxydans TaxID=2683249 RepID=A0A6I4NFG3_9FLAO|nr:hypothetical protein [Flavobacterium hydrocarbonoxydans]MWB92968.1 hypothetical protein [Flavobacterium hydrocarbonoxydans]
MILGFSTHLNGKPTFFVEKIHVGIRIENKVGLSEAHVTPNYNFFVKSKCKPKIHSIREDPKDRWEKGKKIDFFINVRKKDMFRFAPVLPVVSTQSVYMSYAYNDIIEISINGQQLHDQNKILEFVKNDGFDTWEDFFNYFYPLIRKTKDNWYAAKIIHWTDLKY